MRMNIFKLTAAYWIQLYAITHAVEIEPGFPIDCGVPDVQREIKKEADKMKVLVMPNSWPWNVGLWTNHLGNYPYCGGTLISNSLILTAAHCLQTYFKCSRFPVGTEIHLTGDVNQALLIVVGAHDFTKSNGFEQLYTVQSAIVHPNYNQDKPLEGTDLVILKIDGQITLSFAAKPICFPSSRVNVPPGSLCYFTGWGKMYTEWSGGELVKPKSLREAQVQVDLDEFCMQEYPSFKSDWKSCIKTEGTSPCIGDSGGGLFCPSKEDKSWFWYGAICSARKDCLANWAVVNNFSSVHSWIRDSAFFLGL